jgi:DNA polymerase
VAADNDTNRERILNEIALQIEGEIARGIRFWADPAWNESARHLLRTAAAPSATPRRPSARAAAPVAGPVPGGIPPATRPAASAAGNITPRPRTRRVSRPPVQPTAFGPPPTATGRERNWKKQLETLQAEALVCVKCGLHKTRTNVVFNSGSGKVPLVFIGEAPGADEDAQGDAFVGRAGQLLTRIIAAIGLDRKDIYICNVLKCRPPNNRNPLPDEIASCSPFLMKQLDILKPRVICTLGLFATQLMLKTKTPIGKLRGRLFRFNGIPLLPTYHPAALLRNPGLKRTVWEDVQLLRKIMDEGPDESAPQPEMPPDRRPDPPKPTSRDLFA